MTHPRRARTRVACILTFQIIEASYYSPNSPLAAPSRVRLTLRKKDKDKGDRPQSWRTTFHARDPNPSWPHEICVFTEVVVLGAQTHLSAPAVPADEILFEVQV